MPHALLPSPLSRRAWNFIASPEIEGGGKVHTVAGDPGGTTKWGFAQKFNPDIDVTTLTEEQAYERFVRQYWEPLKGDYLPWPLALCLVDSAFNTGQVKAIRQLQRALRVEADGVLGEKTLGAATIACFTPSAARIALNEFLSYRLLDYSYGKEKFRRGWFKRVLLMKDEVSR